MADVYDPIDAGIRRDRQLQHITIVTLLMLALGIGALILWPRVVVSVKSGQAGVIYRFFSGTEMNAIYGEGVHIMWPWNRMHIYDMRLQTREKEYTLLSSGGLPVMLHVAIRYQPDIRMLTQLHVTVGPDYVEKVVFPEVEAVLRRAVGQYGPEEIYNSTRGFLETLVVGSLAKVEDRYVLIDDVLVKSVDLPPVLRDAIIRKLTLHEEQKAYEYRLEIERKEAQRKLIEARGIQDYQKVISESLTEDLLRWQGIQATRDLATSNNAKTVVIGSGKDGLPLILGGDR